VANPRKHPSIAKTNTRPVDVLSVRRVNEQGSDLSSIDGEGTCPYVTLLISKIINSLWGK
jgi:hypothetical protein